MAKTLDAKLIDVSRIEVIEGLKFIDYEYAVTRGLISPRRGYTRKCSVKPKKLPQKQTRKPEYPIQLTNYEQVSVHIDFFRQHTERFGAECLLVKLGDRAAVYRK